MPLFGQRKCDLCNKNPATIKYSRIDGGQVREMLICAVCASEHSPLHRRAEAEAGGLKSLFATLLKEKGMMEAGAKADAAPQTCSVCGMTFESYRRKCLLGCSGCYESFAEPLMADLRKIHGAIHHRGKVPEGQAQAIHQQSTIVGLRRQLSEAVEREDFEAAAHLRDQIHGLENEEKGPEQ